MSVVRRMKRIFAPDGKALIVAMDHGSMDGPCKGLENPGKTIEKIVSGGANAILTTYGISRRYAAELAGIGLIMRSDGGGTSIGPGGGPGRIFFQVEEALRLGADALAVSAFPGAANEAETLENLACIAAEAHKWGLPVLGEMVPGGFDVKPEMRTTENIALSARVGSEYGADIIKTPYADNFTAVTSTSYVPVVILGGAKRGKERDMLADIKAAIDAGASGVAIGRNIWQSENPAAMTAAVAAILHKNASVDEAMDILTKK
ncbi:MAG: deoxyribose-phosphate aldolase [Anaerolineaceae bacterium]|nr:deoxyribose-phosphate aldolase [Anaerolineaceae bacterium]